MKTIITVLFCLLCDIALAATLNSDGSKSDFDTKYASAADGDTITLPSGTFEWTTGATITKGITIQGLGTITRDVNGRATTCGTKIQCSVSGPTIAAEPPANKNVVVTGIEFIKGSTYGPTGFVRADGINTDDRRFILHSCVFNQLQAWAMGIDTVLGVSRSNTFYCNLGGFFTVDARSWNGEAGVDNYGNGSWADSEHYGTDKFFFFEDNTFIGELCHSSSTVTIASSGTVTFTVPAGIESSLGVALSAGIPISAIFWDTTTGKPDNAFAMYGTVDSYSGTTLVMAPTSATGAGTAKSYWTISFRQAGSDGQRGTRVACRHNIYSNGAWQDHGLEASHTRGGRVMEFYNNWMVGNGSANSPALFRSGTGLLHNNHITNYQTATPVFNLVNYSTLQYEGFPWGGPDGRNPWHSNAAAAVVTGTISSATPASLTARDNTKTWTLNQYQNYVVRATSGIAVSSMTRSGTTVTVNTSAAHGFVSGDKVSILGADQRSYNMLYSSCTVVDSDTFTVVLDGPTPASPATGTIKARKHGYYGHLSSTSTDGTMIWAQGVNGADYTLQLEAGDTYEINLVYSVMDQCGMGAGSLLTIPLPENPPAGWPDQAVSPLYQWNNGAALFDTRIDFSGTTYASIKENTNFFNNVAYNYSTFTYPWVGPSGASSGPTPKTKTHGKPGGTQRLVRPVGKSITR